MQSASAKRLLMPAVLCAAAVGVFFGFPALMKRSAPSPRSANEPASHPDEIYKDLISPLAAVAEVDNGWLLAKRLPPRKTPRASTAKGLAMFPGDEHSDEVPGVNRALLTECLEKDAELIAASRRVLQLPGWQRMDWTAKDLMNGGYDARIIFPANVILADAMAKALDGHVDQAWPDILMVVKAGHRISAAGGPMIDLLMGRTLFVMAVRTAAWAGRQVPDAATARLLAADLLPLEDCSAFYTRSVEGEVRWSIERNRLFEAGGEPLEQALQNLYGNLEGGGDQVRKQIQEAAQTDWGGVARTLADTFKRARQVPVTTWTDYRKYQEAGLEQGFSFCYIIAIQSTARVRMARVSLMLRAWMHDHNGQLPDTLNALVPDYLPELPLDPSDGQPLRYTKEKLWSLGTKKRDGEESSPNPQVVQLL